MKGMLLVLGCVADLFWPYDIIPDVIPGLGWIDDLLVLAYLLAQMREGKIPKPPPRRRPPAGGRSSDPSGSPSGSQGRRPATKSQSDLVLDPYEILGINPGAGSADIKKAYRRMIAQYHPDKVAHLGEELRETAHRKTLEIQQAYEELGGN